jgi:hypothetical protein
MRRISRPSSPRSFRKGIESGGLLWNYPRGDGGVRIGLQVPSFSWPEGTTGIGPKLAEIGRTADEAGFASLWVMDHFFQIGPGTT